MKPLWWKLSIMIFFLIICSSFAKSFNVDINKKNDYSQREMIAQEFMIDWHIDKNSYIQDIKTTTLYLQQVKTNNLIDVYKNLETGMQNSIKDSAWPMYGHDVVHTCRSLYSTENNFGIEIWRVRGNKAGEFWGSAIVDNEGSIYFGTKGSDSSLYALYPNGTRKWRFHASGTIWCSPAITENGTIYFTTWGGFGHVYAVNPNGTQQWLFNDGYDSDSSSSPVIGNDGTIYFGSDFKKIYAIAPNGTEKWRYITGDMVMGSPAIGQDGTIYIGSCDNYLYALNPNGTLRWRYNTGSDIKGSASIADDGTIYVPSFNGYLYALNPNGTLKWQASTGSSVAAAGVALAEDDTIYVGTEILRAYYPNGTLRWSMDIQGDIYGTIPAVSADGTIYVSAGPSLVAVNPDGTEKWQKTLSDEQIRSSPSIGENDRVYVGSAFSDYGYLHAFGTIENNEPPDKPTIDGPLQAKIRTSVTYVFQANDTDNTPISYYVDWGDGTNEQTMDYMPGFGVSIKHTWTYKGTYTIRAKAIDSFGLESDWATLTVIMPYEPPQFPFLTWLLERFPNAFPLLRYLLGFNP